MRCTEFRFSPVIVHDSTMERSNTAGRDSHMRRTSCYNGMHFSCSGVLGHLSRIILSHHDSPRYCRTVLGVFSSRVLALFVFLSGLRGAGR